MSNPRKLMWTAVGVMSALASMTMAAAPVADAGDDQTIYVCGATPAEFTLDGSGSYDPDGGGLTYSWTWALGSATGVGPVVSLPAGEHVITLVVNDGTDSSLPDQMVARVVVDGSGPDVDILFPASGIALQDGITLRARASDNSGVASVSFRIRQPDGGAGIPIGQENLAAEFNGATGGWQHGFATSLLDDGYYVVLAKGVDTCGNEAWSETVLISVRNGIIADVVPDLPSSSPFSVGRTIPVKFALKVPQAVDATQPFVYNEELEIKIYQVGTPSNILLQTSVFGDSSTDYRLADSARHYITNFDTLSGPADYVVEVWQLNGVADDVLVGSFTFTTVAHPRGKANAAPVHRFWSPGLGRHFYTIDPAEKDKLKNQYAHTWTYEDVAFYAFADDLEPDVLPIHRFYSPTLHAHFYTISEREKNKLIAKYSHVWQYEGVAFYAYLPGQEPADALPLYRFWSDSLGAHFFTTSEAEKSKLIMEYSHVWTYEGIAWYVY